MSDLRQRLAEAIHGVGGVAYTLPVSDAALAVFADWLRERAAQHRKDEILPRAMSRWCDVRALECEGLADEIASTGGEG